MGTGLSPDMSHKVSPMSESSRVPGNLPQTWGLRAQGPSFNPEYPVEFRESQISAAGLGTWALCDIPSNVRIRRCTVADGTLLTFANLEEYMQSGWDLDDACNYGIGHKACAHDICYLNPGTAMNHADITRKPSFRYAFPERGVIEIWTIRDVKEGEEIFNDYGADFGYVAWYDEFQKSRGNVPLSYLPEIIAKMYTGHTESNYKSSPMAPPANPKQDQQVMAHS